MKEYDFKDLKLSEELLSITDPKEHSIITEYEFNDIDLVDELVTLICPIDAEGPSKLGRYYCLKNGKRVNFYSFEEAEFYAQTTGSKIWAYNK